MKAVLLALGIVAMWVGTVLAGEPKPLFDGKTLDGWKAEGATEYTRDGKKLPIWTVEDGKIVAAGKGFGFLRYDVREFSDFALHVEYRMPASANSGIGIRTTVYDPKKSVATRPSFYSYEVQLLDDAGAKPNEHSSCSLYRYVAPTKNLVQKSPAWNAIDIECKGPRIKIKMNGEQVLDFDQSGHAELQKKPLKGYVSLQTHTNAIEFRSVTIEDLAEGK